jgi:hypothetical protein
VHDYQEPTIDHAEQHLALFVVILAVVNEIDRERIPESCSRLLEAYAVLG